MDQNRALGSADRVAGPTASALLYSAWEWNRKPLQARLPPDALQPPSNIVIPGTLKYVLLLSNLRCP